MGEDKFGSAEDEFFRLKGQLAAKRLTQAQYETALKDLMVQDEQGRYWMLGAESGKWYVHDGRNWNEADPRRPTAASASTAAAQSPPAQAAEAGAKPAPNLKWLFVAIPLLACTLLTLGAVFFFATNPGARRFVFGSPPTPIPIIIPTRVVPTVTPTQTLPRPTLTPLPTATITLTPTATPRPGGNCADPNARWLNVVDGQRLDPYAAMQGTAYAENFDEYIIEYIRPGNVLYRSRTPVVNGTLFVWNTFTVPNGDYLLALVVRLRDGTTLAPCVVRVRVQN